jgi:hypothetical protein
MGPQAGDKMSSERPTQVTAPPFPERGGCARGESVDSIGRQAGDASDHSCLEGRG